MHPVGLHVFGYDGNLRQSVLDRADIGWIPYKCSMRFHRKGGKEIVSNCNLLFWINLTWPDILVDVASWMRWTTWIWLSLFVILCSTCLPFFFMMMMWYNGLLVEDVNNRIFADIQLANTFPECIKVHRGILHCVYVFFFFSGCSTN